MQYDASKKQIISLFSRIVENNSAVPDGAGERPPAPDALV
jgi:hypothetical protein